MDKDNIRRKLVVKNIIIFILLIGIIVLSILYYRLYNDNKLNKNCDNTIESNILSDEEALSKGKEIYDKLTEISTLSLYDMPYCGYDINEVKSQTFTMFSDEIKKENLNFVNEIKYYKSKYKTIKLLKEYLSNYMNKDLIDKFVRDEPITELANLDNDKYKGSEYVSYDNTLYCKYNYIDNKSRYLENYIKDVDPYDMVVVKNTKDRITFLVKSKYVKENVKNFKTECKDIDSCITTKEEQFSIEKKDNEYVASVFTMHE